MAIILPLVVVGAAAGAGILATRRPAMFTVMTGASGQVIPEAPAAPNVQNDAEQKKDKNDSEKQEKEKPDKAVAKSGKVKKSGGGLALPAGFAGLLPGGAAVGAGAATAGAVIGLVAATAGLGFAITGDIGGAGGGLYGLLAGVATPGSSAGVIPAQAGNVGRVLGREIDRLLGGDGTHGTGAVYQAEGYAAGLAVGLYGLQVIPFIGQLVGLTIIIASIVSDTIRLDDTRSGRTVQKNKEEARAVFDKAFAAAQTAALNAGFSLDDSARQVIKANCVEFTIGFWKERNDRRREVWLKKPRGFGLDLIAHDAYGKARGYWVDEIKVVDVIETWSGLASLLACRSTSQSLQQRQKGEKFAIAAVYLEAMESPKDPFVFSDKVHADKWHAAGAFPGSVDENGDLNLPLGGSIDLGASRSQRQFIFRS